LPKRGAADASAVRAFWSGTITFGLVSIPVDLFSATRGRRTAMKMVDTKGRPLGREYYSDEDEHLTQEELVRGYETDKGEMVVISDEELESIAPEMTRDIELRRFVPRGDIPPPYFNRPYFLAPAGKSQKAYQLLARTMQETGRAGIGTFVMRGHQYLVAILSEGNMLRAETLRFADEIRSAHEVGLPKRAKPAGRAVKDFSKEIESLARDELDLDELSDRYAAALEALAEKKAKKGKDLVDPRGEAEDQEQGGAEVIDLMKILKQRLGATASKAAAKNPSTKARRSAARKKR
jgi:DNA end-binding protein Ku